MVKMCTLFKTGTKKFKAPTFAPFGMNREHDIIRVPTNVGVDFEATATKNSLVLDAIESANAPVEKTEVL